MQKEMQTKQLSQWLKDSVNWLIDHQEGCCTYKLDDHLAVCVGWSGGYEAEPDDWKTVNVYRLFAGFKEETIINTINEYWQIELAELEV